MTGADGMACHVRRPRAPDAKHIVIVGENEASSGEFAVKELATGKQEKVPRAELAAYLRGT